MKRYVCNALQLVMILLMLVGHISAETAIPDPIRLKGVTWPLAIAEEIFNGPPIFPEAKRIFYFQAVRGVPLSKLLDLAMFGSFQPGLTIEEATARFGRPTETRSEHGTTLAVYELATTRIEVEDHVYGSAFTAYHQRTVYAYPKSIAQRCATVSTMFDRAIINLIPAKDAVELHIDEAGENGQFAYVLVRGQCVEAINWGKMPVGSD